MSYARWSNDCYNSDVYVYDAEDGYHVHIADVRHISNMPRIPEPDNLADYLSHHLLVIEWEKQATRIPLNKPLAGQSFIFETAKETAEFLEKLKADGYLVPDRAIIFLRQEE